MRWGLPVVVESAGRGDTRLPFSLPRGGIHHFDLRIDLTEVGLRRLDTHV
jgi:hypothetical protein